MGASAVACGKLILLGEHFVVPHEGSAAAPAIALPLRALSCEVHVSRSTTPGCHSDVADGQRSAVEERMGRALAAAAAALKIDATDVEVRSRATFPLSRGFGSSAAFSVALTRALDALASPDQTRDLGAATHAVESVFHGTPSGLDTAVILAERTVRFERGRIVRFLAAGGVDFVAVDSGPRSDASPIISAVKERRVQAPEVWSRMAAHVTELVDLCERALAAGSAADVGRYVDQAHRILADLGLSKPSIEKVLADGRAAGALGGKVSGAGAGGAVVLVAKSGDGERLGRAMTSAGHAVVAVSP